MRSRRSDLDNNRRRHRQTRRQLQVHQLSPVLHHNKRPARQGNPAHQRREHLLNSHLPVCRQVLRECHLLVQSALLLGQLLRVQLSLRL